MDEDKKFMIIAIKEAKKSKELLKCGAVVVRDGKIISKAYNKQRETKDASAHDGINVIRLAGQKLGNKNLEDCTIYCSCEPCTMCLSAMIFAKIKRLVYKDSLKDVAPQIVAIDTKELLSKSPYKFEIVKLSL